jgi:hypothetical protein
LAQSEPSRQTAEGWRFTAAPHADLWFHGLALVGLQGFAPMPLYDAAYGDRLRAAKKAAGVYPTPLDTLAAQLREAFEQDSVFELLHFVPLYFPTSAPLEMLDVLKTVSEGRRPSGFGGRAMASVLRSRSEQRMLGAFTTLLIEEWRRFYREHWVRGETERARIVDEAQRFWDRRLATPLAPFLAEQGLVHGTAYVSVALGPEGRIFQRDPSDLFDNVAAVWALSGEPSAAAFALMRELCYPVVSRLVEQLPIGGRDRVYAERVSSRGAVRCGAALLERHAPDLLPAYRGLFLTQVGEQGESAELFVRVFGIPDGLWSAVQREIRAAPGP